MAEGASRPGRLDGRVQRTSLIGAVLAATVTAAPFMRFVPGYIGTLLHEFGRTVAAWAFGYPAVPAFKFQHGG